MLNYKLFETKKCVYSFEIFPPKQNTSFEAVTKVIKELEVLAPDFISVTYGAGGSVRDNRTVELCKLIKQTTNMEPVAHLTCMGASKQEIESLLSQLMQIGVKNILALRGDKNPLTISNGEFLHASDLITFIKAKYGDTFDICGACYPTGHNESETQKEDIINLKRKVECGAQHLVTQLFFDNNEYYKFLELIDIADINVPVQAGIMPLTNKRQIERLISMSGATLPAKLAKLISRFGDNGEAMRDAGIAYATEQIIDLIANGARGIHLYTMNNAYVATKITQNIKTMLEV